MAFEIEPTREPQGIGNIVVSLSDLVAAGAEDAKQTAQFVVYITMNDGTTVKRAGDLAPHITGVQRDALMAFMDGLRAQAISEIIP